MVVYRIRVSTGGSLYAGSNNPVQMWLVGQHGESALGVLLRPSRAKEDEFKVDVSEYLGPLLFVKLQKWHLIQDDAWFCNWISVKGPGDGGAEYRFPCYRWLEGRGTLTLPEGTACTVVEDTQGLFKKHREEELKEREKVYRWGNWKDGLILNLAGKRLSDLPVDERFLEDKLMDFETSLAVGLTDFVVKLPINVVTHWNDPDDFDCIFRSSYGKLAGRVRDSWKDDAFFGYQFLNGANPMLLRCCVRLPARLVFPPGTEELQAQVEKELQGGTLFVADFSLLDGIKANVIQFRQQFLAAPLVLLKLQPDGQLLPMAIQLELPKIGTTPPPIFLPTDPPVVWLLAKCWVRSCDFQLHELQSHLLRGHLMAEVFAVATMRCLPTIHPVYKLLHPHLRYTMEINLRARNGLVSDCGVFDQIMSTGGGGHVDVVKRAGDLVTYSSFCPPDDLKERGLLDVKSSYYAQDALRLWEVIHRYVEGILDLYYKTDAAVREDHELQHWCREITETGLQGAQDRGFPTSLETRAQACQFVTMCIFTCTGQHSSIHLGQLDWLSWVPNAPCTMRLPPPTTKDATMETLMDTLPNPYQASLQINIIWHLGRPQCVVVPLGQHTQEYFSSLEAKAVLKKFREELAELDKEIEARNESLDIPYEYLRPSLVENSVAI
ncbi:polyunsaturated fatty acid lipoxygenase ALOX15-like [Dipodomys spectabilis]|uniref:polyunsaturated fatty acid lipoxygenase ALOX15-like n=1 Tax=Dipodomys spectabilis TaxID=105255 RepID=UPI001C5402E6|nr:polyunsaturated fatty acid lipoxygenase ALOX15-like [Dipodomys spectabilis]